jgi:RNA-directed DNA polymerase
MPLGNLTSQFFANIYLNELDYFVKHKLKAKYYIRYVDDFIILHESKKQLKKWKYRISYFLKTELNLELHPDKSKIIPLSKPVSFVGFRVFYHNKLLKKFNQRKIQRKLNHSHKLFLENKINYYKIYESMQGAFAYMKHADTYKLRNKLTKQIEEFFPNEISEIEINRYLKSIYLTQPLLYNPP